MKSSLLEQLGQYDRTMLPFHMPGHKRNTALSGEGGYLERLSANCDITEIAGFDNLAESSGILQEIKERAARLWKSEKTELLVNGSTVGILSAIHAAVPMGGTVIVARNCHKSVYNGLLLVGAKPVYLMPATDAQTGICGEITAEQVKEAIEKHPEAALVILTCPTYEGVVSDLTAICETAHDAEIPVLVDAAHGAHFGFGQFPKSAVECGADLTVQSLHKTLPSLTQTALLHYNEHWKKTAKMKGRESRLSHKELVASLNLFQTSSPSYLLMASIDGCIDLLERQGEELFLQWESVLQYFLAETKELSHLQILNLRSEENADRLNDKLVISTSGTNLTGPELMDLLRSEYGIELEMSAERYCIAMTGPGDTKESVGRLAAALCEIDRTLCNQAVSEYIPLPVPEVVFSLLEAREKTWEYCKIDMAKGRIAAETVFAYPPGIPIVTVGERITEAVLAVFAQKETAGVVLHGAEGELAERIRVLL